MTFRSINCIGMNRPWKQLWKVYVRCRPQESLFKKVFAKLPKHQCRSLFLLSFHVFSILLKTSAELCLCSMNIILAHLILDIQTKFRPQKPHGRNIWWTYVKNKIFKSYLGKKEQKLIFLVVSWSDVDFGFLRQFFCLSNQVRK